MHKAFPQTAPEAPVIITHVNECKLIKDCECVAAGRRKCLLFKSHLISESLMENVGQHQNNVVRSNGKYELSRGTEKCVSDIHMWCLLLIKKQKCDS